jgi:hypothetical protein
LQPALLSDQLEVKTRLSDVRAVQALRHYPITRQSDGASEATPIAWVHALGGLCGAGYWLADALAERCVGGFCTRDCLTF